MCNIYLSLTLFMVSAILFMKGVAAAEKTEYKMTLDPDDKFNVTWSFSGLQPQDEVVFMVEVETTGWVGLGFSPKGSMAGADIIIAWVDRNGKAHLQDMMADFNGLPDIDVSQDVSLVSASESNGKTTITFSRKLSTCDDKDRQLMTDTTRLIYAYSFKDPPGSTLSGADYHGAGRRGSKSVYLFDPLPPKEHVPNDALYMDITNNQYDVPSDDTTYYCTFHEAPEIDSKHHLVGLEPIITPGNEGIVHHMVLYSCWNLTLEHLRGTNKTEGVCYTQEMPEFASSCMTTVYAWAVGGGNYYFPEGTGYPLGTGDLNSPEFFMLEIHYDNPAMKDGIIDSSGLRIVYTPKVRDIDVGMLTAGTVNGIMVPPTAEEFNVVAYCHSSCTASWIPEGGITIFSYFLHAHLLGAKIKAEVFRDGKPAEILAIDNAYDFNFQENRLFEKAKMLYPGDTIKVTCTYDSSKRTDVTYGGFSSREEMCLGFFGYYPKQPIAGCESAPSFFFDSDHEIYNKLNVEAKSYPGYPAVDVSTTLAEISWNKDLITEIQDITRLTSHVNQCRQQSNEDRRDLPKLFSIEEYKSLPIGTDNSHCEDGGSNLATIYTSRTSTIMIATLICYGILTTILSA